MAFVVAMLDQLACSFTRVPSGFEAALAEDAALPTGVPRTAARGEEAGVGGVARVTLPPRCKLPVAGDVFTLAAAELEGDVVEPVAMMGAVEVALVVVV